MSIKKGKNSISSLVKFIINGAGMGVALLMILNRYDPSLTPDAFAAPSQTTAAVSGSCNDTPVTAFAMDGDYTMTWAASSATSDPTCSITLDMPNGQVNGNSIPSVNCNNAIDKPGFVVFWNRQPSMKLGGLQCTTQDRAILEVHGDGSDNTSFDIAINTVSATTWDNLKKVDDVSEASKKMLFGSGGQIGTSAIIDGSDNDNSTNGEVEFGGITASKGASRIFFKVDHTNYDIQPGTDRETLTYTFTAQ